LESFCSYSIDQSTDLARQFAVDGNGLVTTVKGLDREAESVHRIHVLAIDKGEDTTESHLSRRVTC